MYHPAAALHQPSLKEVLLADFTRLPEFLRKKPLNVDEIESQEEKIPKNEIKKEEKKDNETRQLSLFG